MPDTRVTSGPAPRCAIIVCHPRVDSYCASLAHKARDVAKECGFTPVVRDLYSVGLDPVPHARDLALHEGGARPAPDVEQELQILGSPTAVILVYPIWFGSPPGLLKCYIERILGAGFGGPGTVPLPASARPQLLLTIATSGASTDWIDKKGIAASAGRLFGAYLAGALAIGTAEHVAIDNVVPTMPPKRGEDGLSLVEKRVKAALLHLWQVQEKGLDHWETLPSPTA
ncbi:hypothetical protein GCM10011515_19070 [Tsuneonella deserti]|uniref:Flavodoxin-like fold domain-containing protein n=1 Tax=Tsuneonella deserti TaxID=2035528 RepID=A0ABQ1SAT2_9SPHN|nr:NAD(P)H-dependent oxidoreductase [Tsuneonella deserti]GGD99445.1 hypothetical protein GCM10011515_19070 [Tsuneonella deserti]